jgi:hypothetical protein
MISSISELTDSQREELIASLSVLVVGSVVEDGEISAEALTAVAEASGNSLNSSLATLFSTVATKAGGIKKFCAAPGSGGGGGGGGGGAAAAAEVVEEKEEEEEVGDAPVVDMFGGGDGGDY